MRFDALSKAARAIWAKSGEPAGHGLLAHMLDVAAVAECLLAREPAETLDWAADELHLARPAVRWIAALAGLHDLGKALAGFQHKWDAGCAADLAAGLPFEPRLLDADKHDRASAKALNRLLTAIVGSRARAAAFSEAVAAHHGHFLSSVEIEGAIRDQEPTPWIAARDEIFGAYWRTLSPAASVASKTPSLAALCWLAGLTSVADWIGSSTDWFPPGERAATTTEHHANALCRADDALDTIGWPRHRPLGTARLGNQVDADAIVGQMLGRKAAKARPLQQAADVLLMQAKAPVLLIVEAPMGEGKTELGYLAHIRLQQMLGHRGLYIGLPTQATGNAMFDRTLDFLRAFGHDGRLDIQLAHGGAALQEDRVLPLRQISGEPGDTVASSAWFAQRRRPLLSPYGVGTVDQALLASLNTKHHFVRLWGLANRVVVLDEVHAYDTYTGTLIEALLRWLRAMRCSVVLMSATLPRSKRDALLSAWAGAKVAVPEVPYPRVVQLDGSELNCRSFESRPQAPVAVAGIGESIDEIAEFAAALLERGGCGAVIVNTVDRAQQLFLRLQDRLNNALPLMLFHARFPGDERQRRERQVLNTFGQGNERPIAALLVATQVVEQSLDIDFDFLVSDLAPIDLLLQRAGRLHRHERVRPSAHADPRLTVAGLLADRGPDLAATRWVPVYDEWVLLRTWAIASRESLWRLPADIDRLVQIVYQDGDLPAGLPPAVLRRIEGTAFGEHLGETQQERLRAEHAVLDARHEFGDAFAGKPRGTDEGDFPGVRNVTRLGPESLVVVPIEVTDTGWRVDPNGAAFDPASPIIDSALARQLVARGVRLSRRELVVALKAMPAPLAFDQHPWLKHSHALPLTDGCCRIGDLRVRVDPELGITYETIDEAESHAR